MKRLFIIFIASMRLFSQEEIIESYAPHIGLTIHEQLLNEFFINIGEIKGEGTGSSIDYTWYLLNPRIEIVENNAHFYGQVRAKTDNFRITRDVVGSVVVSYNEKENIIDVKINEAEVILDFEIFGKKYVLAEIDIAKYFTKSMQLDGPKAFDNIVEYQLPTGQSKKMKVSTKHYEIVLVENAIVFNTTLDFETIAD